MKIFWNQSFPGWSILCLVQKMIIISMANPFNQSDKSDNLTIDFVVISSAYYIIISDNLTINYGKSSVLVWTIFWFSCFNMAVWNSIFINLQKLNQITKLFVIFLVDLVYNSKDRNKSKIYDKY